MLYKNLLYTAVTRASKKTIIISDNKAIYRCLTKDKDTNKNINYDYIIESILNKN
jgi:ATP-dependent exoDNAse (exonuclease V) alpha subunit